MTDSLQTQIEKLHASIAALEAQRTLLGDAVVDTALVALNAQLAALQAQAQLETAPPAEERRLICILFTDIVGSTARAEKLDPEEWRQTVAQLHATVGNIITHHHGTVAQYLGDGLLAFFGAQESREQDAENAIRAALEFQNAIAILDALQKVQVRVGIHSGPVVIGDLGADAHKEFTATGDAMNLAARLQSAAPPGGILISHDTYRYVRGVFDLTPRPPLTVKGKAEPIQTYLVRRAKPRPFRTVTRGVAGIETRTVGRDLEIKRLREAYLDAFENRRVVWAQLIGEAGVGKSRLLADMNDWIDLRAERVWLLRARGFAGDENQSYALVRRLWCDRFQIAEDAPLPEAETRWVEKFLELAGTHPTDETLGTEAAHALGLLVGLPFQSSPHIGALRNDPKQLQGRAFVVSRALLNKLRETNLVVLLLEDLQYADASSWEWLREVVLAESPALAQGLFVLGTARPEWKPPASLRASPDGSPAAPIYIPISLAPLSDDATRELTVELLSRAAGVPDEVVAEIVTRTEGIPYYAEEMVNWFMDRGIIDPSREPWQFVPARWKEAALPATLQQLLLTRLGTLSDAERAALQRGAIFGRHFWTAGVEALGLRASGEVLGHLQPRGLVERQAESSLEGQAEWSFAQTLLREVTYESVLKRERGKLHKAAAQWLEEQAQRAGRVDEFAGLLGEHCERAGELSAAADWYLRAGERAQASSALTEAKRFFDRALELLPPIDRERHWRALLGREAVLHLQGEREPQKADLAALLKLANELDDDARRAEAHFRHSRYLMAMGDFRAAVSAAHEAVAAAQKAGDLGMEMRALARKLMPLTRLGEMEAARQIAEELLARVQSSGNETELAGVLDSLASYYSESGDLARAVQLESQAAEIARRLGDRAKQGLTTGNIGYLYVQMGLYKLARANLEQALALNEAIGDRRMRAYDLSNLGLAYWRSGDGRTARQMEEQALREITATGDAFGRASCQMYLGYIAESAGDYAGAVRRFAEAQEGLNKIGNLSIVMDAVAGLARCALAQGRLDEARELATQVWNYLHTHGAAGMESPTWAYKTVADIFDALDDGEQSRAAIEAGYREMMERAEKISDAQQRQSFLENMAEHRAMVEMWERMKRGS